MAPKKQNNATKVAVAIARDNAPLQEVASASESARPSSQQPWNRFSNASAFPAEAGSGLTTRSPPLSEAVTEAPTTGSRKRRRSPSSPVTLHAASAKESISAPFFHHFESMMPLAVRVGVVPLPGAKQGRTTKHTIPFQATEANAMMIPPALLDRHAVARFLNPKKFFQLPSASEGGGPDVMGWSGVFAEVPIVLPGSGPANGIPSVTSNTEAPGGIMKSIVATTGGEPVVSGAASITVVLSHS